MKEHITDSEMEELLRAHAHEARDIWLSSLPQRDEVPKHTFSRRFTRRMNRLLAQQRRTPRENRVVAFAQRAAVVALVVFAMTGAGVAYQSGFVQQFVVETTEYIESNFFRGETTEHTVFPESVLTYLPDGMEEYEDTSIEEDDLFRYTAYRREDGASIYLEQIAGSVSSYIGTEYATVEHFTIHGETASLVSSGNQVIITWAYQDVFYRLITTDLSVEEARQIALGVEQK